MKAQFFNLRGPTLEALSDGGMNVGKCQQDCDPLAPNHVGAFFKLQNRSLACDHAVNPLFHVIED